MPTANVLRVCMCSITALTGWEELSARSHWNGATKQLSWVLWQCKLLVSWQDDWSIPSTWEYMESEKRHYETQRAGKPSEKGKGTGRGGTRQKMDGIRRIWDKGAGECLPNPNPLVLPLPACVNADVNQQYCWCTAFCNAAGLVSSLVCIGTTNASSPTR